MRLLDPKRPGQMAFGWFATLGPTMVTLMGLNGFGQAHYLPFAIIGMLLGILGASLLASSYRQHPDSRLLRRQTLIALIFLCIPLTAILVTIFGSQTSLIELGVFAGTWLAVVVSAWLAISFLTEDYQRRLKAQDATPERGLHFDEFRHNISAVFMLGTLLPLLMVGAVDFFQTGATGTIDQRSIWVHLLLFGATILIISWWVGNPFVSRSLIAAFGITTLLSLPLFHISPQSLYDLAIVPIPGVGDALAVAVCAPAVVVLLYWWLKTPPGDPQEGFCCGFTVGAIPAYTVGTSLAALWTWIPSARAMLEAADASPALRGSVIVGDIVHSIAITQVINLLPALLLGFLGMIRASHNTTTEKEPMQPEAAPPPLQSLLLTTGLLWMVNTYVVSETVRQLNAVTATFIVVSPLPALAVEWLGIFPAAICFLISFSVLMYRAWRSPSPPPLILHLALGFGAVAVSIISYIIYPQFLPLFSVYGALLGGAFCVLTIMRRIRLGAPVPEDKTWGQRLYEGLAFSLVAGTATITFSFATATMVLGYVSVQDAKGLGYLRDNLAAPPLASILTSIQTLADMWVYVFGLWALVTMIWMALVVTYLVMTAAIHHAGQATDELTSTPATTEPSSRAV